MTSFDIFLYLISCGFGGMILWMIFRTIREDLSGEPWQVRLIMHGAVAVCSLMAVGVIWASTAKFFDFGPVEIMGWRVKEIFLGLFFTIPVIVAVPLAVSATRAARERRRFVKLISTISEEDLDEIYHAIESMSDAPPTGFVLAKTNRTTQAMECRISIPDSIEGFPWAGKSYEFDADRHDVFFRPVTITETETHVRGEVLRPVVTPRYKTKSGNFKNRFSPKLMLSSSDELRSKLIRLFPRFPDRLLGYLLGIGGAGGECAQIRIGTTAAWVQLPETPNCKKCKRRMILIVQLPGEFLKPKWIQEGVIYLFGCRRHPENTEIVTQFY